MCGWLGSFTDLVEIVKLVEERKLNLETIVSKFFKFEEISQAFEDLKRGKIIGRCVILLS
jgi:Zn-dependent alcohol dehydrogenase